MIKSITFAAFCLLAGISEVSADYTHLLIRANDGSETYVVSSDLHINVSDGNLLLSSPNGFDVLSIAGLASMEFTDSGAGLNTIQTVRDIDVYTVEGHNMGHYPSLDAACEEITATGIYMVISKDKSFKILIAK